MDDNSEAMRVKEEPSETWPVTGDYRNIDSLDYCKAEKVETFSSHGLSTNNENGAILVQERLDENISPDFECKYVKSELPSLSIPICKSEYQHFQLSVKKENKNVTNYAFEKSLIILCKRGFNYDKKCHINVSSCIKLVEHEKLKSFEKNFGKISLDESKRLQETNTTREGQKNHSQTILERIRPYKCNICGKSFEQKGKLKRHVNGVHNRIKPFECDICHKSFGDKSNLNKHISTVHGRIKPFECEVCRKSFGQKISLKSHVNTVHDRIKPFECEICHKSFGLKSNLQIHKNSVHNRIKSFECEICHKSFDRRDYLKTHINTVHDRIKPFECDICHKFFGRKGNIKRHINLAHNRIKPFECDVRDKS